MTRFVYLADTHLGPDALEYQQQPACPGKAREILRALDSWIREDGGVDLILHGGDLVDAGTPDAIGQASEQVRFSRPLHLCLGNHDLTGKESLAHWLKLCPDLFPGGQPEYSIQREDCVIHVVPNHWNAIPYYWERQESAPVFFPHQMEALRARCRAAAGRPQILLTHSPVFGLPPEQTGFSEPYHSPGEAFTRNVVNLVESQPDIRCVLGAHNHMNMRIERGGVHYVTTSSLIEAPFEFKVFEINGGRVSMETVSLADRLPFVADYDATRAYVQGRACDRAFSHVASPN